MKRKLCFRGIFHFSFLKGWTQFKNSRKRLGFYLDKYLYIRQPSNESCHSRSAAQNAAKLYNSANRGDFYTDRSTNDFSRQIYHSFRKAISWHLESDTEPKWLDGNSKSMQTAFECIPADIYSFFHDELDSYILTSKD